MPISQAAASNKDCISGKRVAFTGRMASMRRAEIQALVARAGGIPVDNVTRETDILVVGVEGWRVLRGTASRKLRRADELIAHGHARLQILSEAVFLERLGIATPDQEPVTCNIDEAARLLGVPKEQLRRWEQFGLIRSGAGRFAFQDLVSLRAVALLIQEGVPASTLAQGLQSLSRWMDTERPLAQARLVAESGRLVAEFRGLRFDTDGQLALNFGAPPQCGGKAVRLSKSVAPLEHEDAEAWLEWGADCEAEGQWSDAESAYQRALELDPACSDANFRLGVLAERREDPRAAARFFHRTAVLDPEMVEAWCRLGQAQARLGRLYEAIEALRRVLALAPGHAQAYFHLAECHERLNQPGEAVVCWHRFLRREPVGEQAEIARLHLAAHKLFHSLEGF